MNNNLVARFGFLYGFLGLAVLLAGFATYKAYSIPTPKADLTLAHKADISKALGENSLGKVACAYTVKTAATQGVILNSCKVTHVVVVGNTAKVTLSQTDTHGTHYTVTVDLNKGIWQPAGLKITA